MLMGCGHKAEVVDSENTDQNHIFQSYIASYDANKDQLQIKAAFFVDNASGPVLKLTKKASVAFNSKKMKWNREGYYTLSMTGLPDTFTFVYWNNHKEKFTNKLTLNKLIIEQEFITLHKDSTTNLSCSGLPFDANESVMLVVHTEGKEPIEIETDTHDNTITIQPEYLIPLNKGKYTGQFVRKNYGSELMSTDRGGGWESEYFTTDKQIIIK